MKKTLLVLALCILPLIAAASMVQRNDAALRYGMGGQVFASPSAQVWVYSTGTTSIVPIYSDSTGSTPLTQPVIADKFGQYSYYVAPGVYDESIIGTSGTISEKGIVIWSDLYSDTSGTAQYSNNFRTFSTTTSGIVPASGPTSTAFLRSDGTWTTPSSGSTYTIFTPSQAGLVPSSNYLSGDAPHYINSQGIWSMITDTYESPSSGWGQAYNVSDYSYASGGLAADDYNGITLFDYTGYGLVLSSNITNTAGFRVYGNDGAAVEFYLVPFSSSIYNAPYLTTYASGIQGNPLPNGISQNFILGTDLNTVGTYTPRPNAAVLTSPTSTTIDNNFLNTFSTNTSGIVPASDATYSTTEYLRGDGTWTTPSASPASYESTTAYLMDSSKTISTAEIPLNKLSLVTVCGSFSALQSYCTGTINSTANAVIGIDTLGTAAWDNIRQIQVPIFSNGTAFVAYGCITDRVYSSSYPDTYDGTLNAVFSGATCSNMVKKLNVISR